MSEAAKKKTAQEIGTASPPPMTGARQQWDRAKASKPGKIQPKEFPGFTYDYVPEKGVFVIRTAPDTEYYTVGKPVKTDSNVHKTLLGYLPKEPRVLNLGEETITSDPKITPITTATGYKDLDTTILSHILQTSTQKYSKGVQALGSFLQTAWTIPPQGIYRDLMGASPAPGTPEFKWDAGLTQQRKERLMAWSPAIAKNSGQEVADRLTKIVEYVSKAYEDARMAREELEQRGALKRASVAETLSKIANDLDQKGHARLADKIDAVLKKVTG